MMIGCVLCPKLMMLSLPGHFWMITFLLPGTGAVWFGVQKTALVPQLQCYDMLSVIFRVLYTGRGPCPQGHGPRN